MGKRKHVAGGRCDALNAQSVSRTLPVADMHPERALSGVVQPVAARAGCMSAASRSERWDVGPATRSQYVVRYRSTSHLETCEM
jgi:hypothetical protein